MALMSERALSEPASIAVLLPVFNDDGRLDANASVTFSSRIPAFM
jgi:hypothetical protein